VRDPARASSLGLVPHPPPSHPVLERPKSHENLTAALFTTSLDFFLPPFGYNFTAMATPLRRKRNPKGLHLKSTPDPSPTSDPSLALPTKPAAGKKRPPPMTLKAPKIAVTSNDHDGNLLTVPHPPSSAPPTASASKTYHSALSEKLANFGEDLKNEDLKDIQELGQGNGGSVKKVEHTPTGTIMAKKVCGFSFSRAHPLRPTINA